MSETNNTRSGFLHETLILAVIVAVGVVMGAFIGEVSPVFVGLGVFSKMGALAFDLVIVAGIVYGIGRIRRWRG